MQRTLLCSLILLTAPEGAAAGDLCPPGPGGAFRCPGPLDGPDARFCCGSCASPYCCPSEGARLDQQGCLAERPPAASEPPLPNATEAAGPDGDCTTTSPAGTEEGGNVSHSAAPPAAISSQTGSRDQLNAVYFFLVVLGFIAMIYGIHYGVTLRKYPQPPEVDLAICSDYLPPSTIFDHDLSQFQCPADSHYDNEESIEMQDFSTRPRLSSEPPPYHNDDPPPYTLHAVTPLQGVDWMSGQNRGKNMCCGCGNAGYRAEGGAEASTSRPVEDLGRGTNPPLEAETVPVRPVEGAVADLPEDGAGEMPEASVPLPGIEEEEPGTIEVLPEGVEGGMETFSIRL